jgi:uncharacterized protein
VPRQSPIPDELDKPFYEAANEERFVMQHCDACDRFQYPPQPTCSTCGSESSLSWRELKGDGTIYSYAVVFDTPIASLAADVPYNVAVIDLDEAPGINMMSQLPGTPPDEVPIGGKVALTFITTEATGQKVPEWKLVQ